MTTEKPAIDPLLLSAWLDGELGAVQDAQVQAWLADHPDDAAMVQAWSADRDLLRAQLSPLAHDALPAATLALLQEPAAQPVARSAQPAQQPRWRMAAAAAGLLLVGGIAGAALMWQAQVQGWPGVMAKAPTGQNAPNAPIAIEWVHRAALAHTVYVPEVRHAVEVKANEEHLARWLTKRLTMPVKLFDLRAHGFELVGGRLLPDAQTPSAQLMYQAIEGKQRVTVYLRKPEANTPAAFRFEREGELSLFYWVDGPTGYALVGTLPRERLLTMAESIYQQGVAPNPPTPPVAPASSAAAPAASAILPVAAPK